MNDRAKILDKIRKCLALGKSPNEHEAAAALRQAVKMMQMHGVTEEDVGQTSYTNAQWRAPDYKHARRKPVIILVVAGLMKHALGVEPVIEEERGNHAVRYFGPRVRVELAIHAHVVVYRACGAAWRAYAKANPEMAGRVNARASFWLGWCDAVKSKVEALLPTQEEAAGTEVAKSRHYRGELEEVKPGSRSIYTGAREEGQRAGQAFDIHRPVGQNRARLK